MTTEENQNTLKKKFEVGFFNEAEMTFWCAKGLGLNENPMRQGTHIFLYRDQAWTFDPLNDDAHVMALVKLLQPLISYSDTESVWRVHIGINEGMVTTHAADFNLAVTHCAAKYFQSLEIQRMVRELQQELKT